MCKFVTLLLVSLFSISIFAQRGVIVRVKNPNGREVVLYENSYALIIGNSDYRDGSWGKLPGVKADVLAVSEILCRHNFKVEIAENLTSENFESRIKTFINKYGKAAKNRILIYYAGHGYKQKSVGDRREIGYVVPTDAPSPQNSEFVNYAVPMDTIESYARLIQSTHALFVFDNCFSGKLVSRGAIIVPEQINEQVGGAVRQFITSGSSEQEVPDESDFRRAFVRGLEANADNNADSFTTASELAVFIRKELNGKSQIPQYGKINDESLNIGDFVFAKPDGTGNCAKRDEPAQSNVETYDYPANDDSVKTVESNYFKFNLQFCKLSGNTLNCRVDITNQEVDRDITFSRKTSIYDDLGNTYPVKSVTIGAKNGVTAFNQIVNGVTVSVNFSFENFSPNAGKIVKFAVYAGQRQGSSFNFEYRNISLNRKIRIADEKFIQKSEMSGFTFGLDGCKKSGSIVFCDLTVINNGTDQKISFSRSSNLIDGVGLSYPVKRVDVALQSGMTAYLEFVNKVRVKVKVTVENVPPEIEKIGLLSLGITPQNGKRFTVEFRGINLE